MFTLARRPALTGFALVAGLSIAHADPIDLTDLTGREIELTEPAGFTAITRQDQTQIYQEVIAAPATGVSAPACGHDAAPTGELTTSFLSICAEVKDNRILPKGYLAPDQRRQIAAALGADNALADDSGTTAVGDNPDYTSGGGDSLEYRIPLSDLPSGSLPASVEANLYYQAIPPFHLQDRLCTAKGADVDRLHYLVPISISLTPRRKGGS